MVAKICPKIAESHDELPNWLKHRLELEGPKGPAHTKITKDVFDVVDKYLEEATNEGQEMNMNSVEALLADAIDAYNGEVAKWRTSRTEADLQAVNTMMDRGASQEEIDKLVREQDARKAAWPHPIKLGETPRALNQLAFTFASKYGFSTFHQDKPMKHLKRDHPHVQHVMDFILMNVKTHQVHEKLLCNFDQVWSCLFEPMRRTLWKTNPGEGAKDDLAKYPRRQVLRAAMQQHFEETVQEPVHVKNQKWQAKLADIRGYGGVNTIFAWRIGFY